MSDDSARIEQIRNRMQTLRVELHDDVREVVVSTREMTDWKTYVRRYPWACLGIAAGVGFMIVPTRPKQTFVQPSDSQVMKLAKQDRLHINTEPASPAKKSLMTTAFMFLVTAAVRAGVAYAGQAIGKQLQGDSNGAFGARSTQHASGDYR